ncbi:MAG TPA: rod shape-determining protein RodA [Verrucomicrobiae bacterium]|nr:rod shape-determining protein RodA [Verrucomicrobiae bacterium]
MFDKRMFRNLDYLFILVVFVLLGISLVVMSTASIGAMDSEPYFYLKKQIIWICIGLGLMIGLVAVDYQALRKFSWWLYGINLAMLIAVFFFGEAAKGAARWIPIAGSLKIQPSEFAKFIIIVCFADFLAKRKGKLNRLIDFIPCFLYVGIPMVLIVKQPDLGTGLVLGAILIGMMVVGGAKLWKFVGLMVLVLSIAVGSIYAHTQFGMPLPLKDYQIKRITTLLNPSTETDIKGDAYQVAQSIVAIGSGGMWGKGYREGTQGQLNFLPEHHTDFVFAVVAEEFGFIGSVTILFLFMILLLRGIGIAMNAKDQFGTLVVTGVVSMYAFHILINVGMVSGIAPVTGIPLPLISYGGSAMWSNLLAIGLIINVSLRRQKLMF